MARTVPHLKDLSLETQSPTLQNMAEHKEERTFAKFSELPIELRELVWKSATPKGRVMRLRINWERQRYHVIGNFSRVPIILHICQESREVGLRMFVLGFPNLSAKHQVYWSPNSDTIYLLPAQWMMVPGPTNPFQSRISHVLPNVHHLALPVNTRLLNILTKPWMLAGLRSLSSLRSLTLLTAHHDNYLGTPFPSSIMLYEALDVKVWRLSFNEPGDYGAHEAETPSSIEQRISEGMEKFKAEKKMEWDIPSVEFLVLGRKRFKKSGFCSHGRGVGVAGSRAKEEGDEGEDGDYDLSEASHEAANWSRTPFMST